MEGTFSFSPEDYPQLDSTYYGSQSLGHENHLDAKESHLYDVTDDTCDQNNDIQYFNGMRKLQSEE